jgi:hypothetical protein
LTYQIERLHYTRYYSYICTVFEVGNMMYIIIGATVVVVVVAVVVVSQYT